MVETVKQAEDGQDVIVRLFEYTNWRGLVTLTFGRQVVRAERCDLLERKLESLETDADPAAITLAVKPYEIVTICVQLEQGATT